MADRNDPTVKAWLTPIETMQALIDALSTARNLCASFIDLGVQTNHALNSGRALLAQEHSSARYRIEHDGFVGTQIGTYRRLDGEEGVVLQQDGTNIVHVYRRKWLQPISSAKETAKPGAHTQGLKGYCHAIVCGCNHGAGDADCSNWEPT